LILFLALVASPLAAAQDLGSEEILENLRSTAEALTDVRFVLSGELQEGDGSVIALELEVAAIPDLQLARAEFVLPDALADNIVIVDGDAVYNYLFLTNQITILSADDPDALGDLIEVPSEGADLDLSFDVSALFEGWDVEVLGYEESPVGDVYNLRFSNQNLGAEVSHVEAQVVDGEWVPYRLTLFDIDGSILTTLVFTDLVKDPGLEPAALRALPADAEVFDER
jgi:outer membrane lipoprotein-sorting protein